MEVSVPMCNAPGFRIAAKMRFEIPQRSYIGWNVVVLEDRLDDIS